MRKQLKHHTVQFACLVLIATSAIARADETEPKSPADIPVPDSPAAASLGSTTPILRPSTAKDFAATFARVANRNGKLQSGVSLEVAPFVLATDSKGIDGYRSGVSDNENKANRASNDTLTTKWNRGALGLPAIAPMWSLANTTLSIATVGKDGSSSSADRIAAGIKLPWFDEGDPRLDLVFSECFDRVMTANPLVIGGDATSKADADTKRKTEIAKCKKGQYPWNAGAASIAFAQTWTDVSNATKSDLQRDARYVWLSYASSLDTVGKPRAMQLVVQAKFARNAIDRDTAAIAGAPLVRYDGNAGVVHFRMGSEKNNLDVSASLDRRSYSDGRTDRVKLGALGYEFMVTKNLWLKLTMGSERSEKTGSSPFVLTAIKWGSSDSATFAPGK